MPSRFRPAAFLGMTLALAAVRALHPASLSLVVAYPTPRAVLGGGDSAFVFGRVEAGGATVQVNGVTASVAPSGGWLAWIPIPSDGTFPIEVVARTAIDSARVVVPVSRPARFVPPTRGVWIDSLSLSPRGRLWVPRTDDIALSVRAAPGATLQLRLPDGTRIPLVPGTATEPVPEGIRNFDRDSLNLRPRLLLDRFTGMLRGRAVGVPLGSPTNPSSVTAPVRSQPLLEAVLGRDTARMRWPLQVTLMDTLPVGVELDDRVGATAPTDGITIGRTVPGGTYHWFFPVGVRSVVRGRRDDDLQLALSATSTAWVPASESRPLPAGTPRPHAVMSSLTTSPQADRVVLRIPLSERIPYQVEETRDGLHVVLYGASGDADWTRLAPGDSLIRAATWWQRTTDELVVDVALAPPLWGWRIRYEGSDLLLEIRRPPAVDARAPLRGRRIVIDPGHPPAGATGPTGLREADANLAIALAIVPLLEAEGAQVLLTRARDTSIDLWPRVQFAERAGADLLVSIHNNALPDGVNPFTNNGTSTFYNHLNSLPLAIAVQRALTASLGLRDLGVARGDLALVRGSWVPSVMCEGMFVIVPEQEEALRSEAGQQRYAAGVVAGLRAFLAGLGRGTPRS